MEVIKDQYFQGERPLYARRNGLRLENVKIGPGESSIKEGANISFDKLPAGVYIVRMGNKVIKVRK